MKRIVLLGMLLVCATGCRCGLISNLFRGAPCNAACTAASCNDCGSHVSSYGSYGSDVVGNEYYGGEVVGDYYGGAVVGDTVVGGSTITSPPMAPIVTD